MQEEPRRKYIDVVFVVVIAICVLLLLAYQVANVLELAAEAASTPTTRPAATAVGSMPAAGGERTPSTSGEALPTATAFMPEG